MDDFYFLSFTLRLTKCMNDIIHDEKSEDKRSKEYFHLLLEKLLRLVLSI